MYKEFEIYRSNVLPAMLEDLVKILNLPSNESLKQLSIGYRPADRSWVFPERDAHGHIIGLMRRFPDEKKFMIKDSRRGFYFAPATVHDTGPNRYISGSHNWTRVSEDHLCPICEKPDWCLISSENITDPCAVICSRIKKGAKKQLESCGFLHILKEEGKLSNQKPIIPTSEYPYLIVEGASDWLIGTTLGFVTIGKPYANHSCSELIPLLTGQDVLVLGENDGGPGEEGMNVTFEGLRRHCNVVKLLPPIGIKDLREWYVQRNVSRFELMEEAEKRGQNVPDDNILEDISPLALAERWLTYHTYDNICTVHSFNRQWVKYQDGKYVEWPDNEVRGNIYNYFKGMNYSRLDKKNQVYINIFNLNRTRVNDIMDACNAFCPITDDPPIWLNGRESPKPVDTIVFRNGILDIEKYLDGGTDLIPSTPALFTLTAIPHNFDPKATCDFTQSIINDICSDDEEKIKLLQEWFGYNLVADQSMEKMMLFIGRPRSGKSTILEMLKAMLGSQQCASTSFSKLCSNFGCQPLIGKLAAIMSDASVPRHLDATHALEKIKQITGGDPVGINRKFMPEIAAIVLKCRFTIAVNTLPELPDHANALEPRLNLIYFKESYAGHEDRTLKQKLIQSKESEGMILWALEGLKRLREQGEFTNPESSRPLMREFITLSSPISEFMKECCEIESDKFITRIQLFDAWREWAISTGQRPGSQAQLSQQLLSLYPDLTVVPMTLREIPINCYKGIDLTPQARKIYLEEKI